MTGGLLVARMNWEYIRVDVRLPRHPKLDGASYATRWTLLALWCHCGEELTDGFVRQSVWLATGTANARADLIRRGLAKRVRRGYQMHDYLDWNRSKEEAEELSSKRAAAGSKGGKAKASATANARRLAKQNGSKHVAEAEAEAEADFYGPLTRSPIALRPYGADDQKGSGLYPRHAKDELT